MGEGRHKGGAIPLEPGLNVAQVEAKGLEGGGTVGPGGVAPDQEGTALLFCFLKKVS